MLIPWQRLDYTVVGVFKSSQDDLSFHTAHLADFCMLLQDDLEEVQPPLFFQDQSHQFLLQCHTVLFPFFSFSLPSTEGRKQVLEHTWNVLFYTQEDKDSIFSFGIFKVYLTRSM